MVHSAIERPKPNWLNRKRIRRQAFLLAIALWVGYLVAIATPGMRDRFGHLKGADFLHGYVLGTVALEHRSDALYDPVAQSQIGQERVPASFGDYFLPVYGPQYSLIYAPFALLPYGWAAAIWMLLSAAIYASCCYAIWRTCPNLRDDGWTVAFAAAAFPGFFALIAFGQNSALALAALTGTYFALRGRRSVAAGLCLGLLAYKPQLALVFAFVFLASLILPRHAPGLSLPADPYGSGGERLRQRPGQRPQQRSQGKSQGRLAAGKVVLGAFISVIAQFAVAWLWYGSGALVAYARVLTTLGSATKILEPRPYLMHSLRALWSLLLPWPQLAFVLYVVTAVAMLALAFVWWRKPTPLEHRFTLMLLTTVLVAPHLTVYDLVILAPAFLWIADWLQINTHYAPRIAWLLYLTCLLPFAGPLTLWIHLQLSVICMAMLAICFAIQSQNAGATVLESKP